MARPPAFDLARELAKPSFTPGRGDIPALVELVVAGAEPAAARAAAALARLDARAALAARLDGADEPRGDASGPERTPESEARRRGQFDDDAQARAPENDARPRGAGGDASRLDDGAPARARENDARRRGAGTDASQLDDGAPARARANDVRRRGAGGDASRLDDGARARAPENDVRRRGAGGDASRLDDGARARARENDARGRGAGTDASRLDDGARARAPENDARRRGAGTDASRLDDGARAQARENDARGRGAGGDASRLDDGARARLVAALGLVARAGDEVAGELVIARLADGSARVRRAAAVALGKLGGERARAAVTARWDAGDATPDERRALAEALGKLGGVEARARLAELEAGDDAELERRRDRALLIAEREARRGEASELAVDVPPPAPITVRLGCRAGLGELLVAELAALGLRPVARGPAAADVQLAGPWSTLFASRLWATAAIRIALPDGDLAAALVRALTAPALRALLAAWTRGPIRWRLGFATGHKRAVIWRVARDVTAAAPELINDPTATTWDFLVTAPDAEAAHTGRHARRDREAEATHRGRARRDREAEAIYRDRAHRDREADATYRGRAHRDREAEATYRGRARRELGEAERGADRDPGQQVREVTKHRGSGERVLEVVPRRMPDPRFAWRVAEVPAASHPTVAAALAWVGEVRLDDRVWDPFCGSGAELIERARRGPARALLGSDLDDAALAAAQANLAAAGVTAALARADACTHDPGAVDLILTNPPLGSRVQVDAAALLAAALPNFARRLAPGGRLVWITPAPRRTTPVAERLGLRRARALPVDLGGVRGQLERWDRRS